MIQYQLPLAERCTNQEVRHKAVGPHSKTSYNAWRDGFGVASPRLTVPRCQHRRAACRGDLGYLSNRTIHHMTGRHVDPKIVVALLGISICAACSPGGIGSPDAFEQSGDATAETDLVADEQSTWTATQPCVGDENCPAGHCDPQLHACFECSQSTDCADLSICENHRCLAGVRCKTDAQCKTVGGVCDLSIGACADCVVDGDCGTGKVCDSRRCVSMSPCISSKDCPVVCDKLKGRCVGCQFAADCPLGQYCSANTCIDRVCTSGGCVDKQFFACLPEGGGYQAGVNCDDGNPCTLDECAAGGCNHKNTGVLSAPEIPDDGIDNNCNSQTDEVENHCDAIALGSEPTEITLAVDLCSATTSVFLERAAPDALVTRSDFIGVKPLIGSRIAVFSTGTARQNGEDSFKLPQLGTDFKSSGTQSADLVCGPGEVHDFSAWTTTAVVPEGVHSLVVFWRLLSGESNPEKYDDGATLIVKTSAWSGNVIVDDGGSCFSISKIGSCSGCTSLAGSSYGYPLATRWRKVSIPVVPGEPVQVTASIFDRVDGFGDSVLILDGFHWSGNSVVKVTSEWVDETGGGSVGDGSDLDDASVDATSGSDVGDGATYDAGDTVAMDSMSGETSGDSTAGQCVGTNDCILYGKCHSVGGKCVAVSDSDCTPLGECKSVGKCSAVDGACVAAKDADCLNCEFCKISGQCSVSNGSCAILSDADCQKSNLCALYGRCTLTGDVCGVGSDADCAQSQYCAKFSYCKSKDGMCCTSSGDCL